MLDLRVRQRAARTSYLDEETKARPWRNKLSCPYALQDSDPGKAPK